jgi:hypothetical protein
MQALPKGAMEMTWEELFSIEKGICGDKHPSGQYVCNREPNHAGNHAATTGPVWVGSHGKQMLSEASGSAQSEAKKS